MRCSTLGCALAIGALNWLPMPALAQEHAHGAAELGTVNFPVTCSPEAQRRMNVAVAMLHSFWFPEARRNFEAVAAADPDCGIAWWGVALTWFGNPMAGGSTGESQAAGWAAVQKGQAAGGRSERDRAYIDAAAALFRDHATVNNRTRMRAYEQAMKAIAARYPQDTEARIFHAIFIVANAPPTDLTFTQQKIAANVLNSLYREQPRHPGLAHYIIHAFDSPPLARLALDAARQYADIAPAAPHALHMPSHIFTRLGYWDESIRTNRRSADLEETPGGKSHPMDYLVYAYLQQGKDEEALKVIRELGGNTSGEYIAGALGSYNAVAMPARYALERDDWTTAARLAIPQAPPSVEAVTRFARGLGAARSGNAEAAKAETAAMSRLVQELTRQNDTYWAHVVDAQRMAVQAWIAHLEGDHDQAILIARAAADKEEQVEKHPVTPGPLIPARELLGDILMQHRMPGEALLAYERVMQKEPNRLRTLAGAARAARAAGKPDVAARHTNAIRALIDPASPRAGVLLSTR